MKSIAWISSDGDRLEIRNGNDQNYYLSQITGLNSADMEVLTQRAPYQSGRTSIDALVRSRSIKFRLVIRQTSTLDLEGARRYIGRIFSPINYLGQVNLGRLEYIRDDDLEFAIDAVPSGLDMPGTSPSRGPRHQLASIYLECEDGFFRDLTASTQALVIDVSQAVLNVGDVPTLPLASITGPSNIPRLSNLSTGKYIEFSDNLAAGYRLDLDFRFGKKSATRVKISDSTTTDWYSLINPASEWWPLVVGSNSIKLTSQDTSGSAVLTWSNQYQSIA
jgi:hypothetical protein